MIKNKKKLILVVLTIIVIILVSFIRSTLSKYTTKTISDLSFNIAYSIVGFDTYAVNNLAIDKVYPSDTPFEYNLCSVANFEEKEDESGNIKIRKTKAAMDYKIILTVTTNLPLEFAAKSYRVSKSTLDDLKADTDDANASNWVDCSVTSRIFKDVDGTYYKEIIIVDEDETLPTLEVGSFIMDKYKLLVTFPTQYSDVSFSDLVENCQIQLDAVQTTASSS